MRSVRPPPQHANGSFHCPLRGPCFAAAGVPFPSYRAANEAIARYQACPSATARQRRVAQLYLRHLPLVRKSLSRFCARSRCYPGGCLIEDLGGETYPAFRQALEEYDPSFGVDFAGYVSRRLYWVLQHCARRLGRAAWQGQGLELADPPSSDLEEERLLDRLLAQDLLGQLDAEEAELLVRHAAGHTHRELAASNGLSPAAARKRLERLRARLRAVASA